MNLYIDMDSTVFDYFNAYKEAHYRETGAYLSISEESVDGYHGINELFGVPDEEKYKYLTEEFFENMKPYEDSIDSINTIKEVYDLNIYFVSYAVTLDAYKGKVKSLQKHFPDWFEFDKHLIIMRDKHILTSGIIVDDNPFVINNSWRHHKTVVFDKPWNRKDVIFNYRAKNWKYVIEAIDILTGGEI